MEDALKFTKTVIQQLPSPNQTLGIRQSESRALEKRFTSLPQMSSLSSFNQNKNQNQLNSTRVSDHTGLTERGSQNDEVTNCGLPSYGRAPTELICNQNDFSVNEVGNESVDSERNISCSTDKMRLLEFKVNSNTNHQEEHHENFSSNGNSIYTNKVEMSEGQKRVQNQKTGSFKAPSHWNRSKIDEYSDMEVSSSDSVNEPLKTTYGVSKRVLIGKNKKYILSSRYTRIEVGNQNGQTDSLELQRSNARDNLKRNASDFNYSKEKSCNYSVDASNLSQSTQSDEVDVTSLTDSLSLSKTQGSRPRSKLDDCCIVDDENEVKPENDVSYREEVCQEHQTSTSVLHLTTDEVISLSDGTIENELHESNVNIDCDKIDDSKDDSNDDSNIGSNDDSNYDGKNGSKNGSENDSKNDSNNNSNIHKNDYSNNDNNDDSDNNNDHDDDCVEENYSYGNEMLEGDGNSSNEVSENVNNCDSMQIENNGSNIHFYEQTKNLSDSFETDDDNSYNADSGTKLNSKKVDGSLKSKHEEKEFKSPFAMVAVVSKILKATPENNSSVARVSTPFPRENVGSGFIKRREKNKNLHFTPYPKSKFV